MQKAKLILLVEDERDLSDVICMNLEREGFACRCVSDGRAALTISQADPPDLIVLDRMMPELSGDAVTAALRRNPKTESIPIIMLTAKAAESDQLAGFALGVDDYVTKPFSVRTLVARIHAVLRRAPKTKESERRITVGPVCLDTERHEVLIDGARVDLTATEFRILQTLMTADGRVMTRAQVIDSVLGTSVAVTDRTIDVHITALRRKMKVGNTDLRAPDWIQTVRGVGYTFRQPA